MQTSHASQEIASDFLAGGGEMGALTRKHNWAATPLGPPDTWPQSLRTSVRILLTSNHPMFIWWGPELIQFYNDAYRKTMGPERHPSALGQPGRDCWEEIWPIIGPQIDYVMAGKGATWHEDQLVPVTRNGFLQEVYWTYGYSPIHAEHGVGGVLVVCNDTTAHVVSERRLRLVQALGKTATQPSTPAAAYQHAAAALSGFPEDLPFSLLYLIDQSRTEVRLEVASGLASHGLPALSHVALAEPASAIERAVAAAVATRRPVEIDDLPFEFAGLVHGKWPEPVRRAIALPIQPAGHAEAIGVLVAGLSPRLPFDAPYRQFLTLAIDQIGAAIAGVLASEQNRNERQRLRRLFEQAPGFICVLNGPQHVFEMTNTAFTQLIGYRDVIGKPVREALPEIEGQGFFELLDRAYTSGEPFVGTTMRMMLQTEPGATAEECFLNFVYQPITDPSGAISGIFVEGNVVTDRVRAEERQSLLIRELHHRVKNTLATVLAIMGSTARTATSIDEFQQSFTTRIASLAKTHTLLTQDHRQTIGFQDLLQAELDPYDDGQRVILSGPPVRLPADVAVPLGMAVHELATNAVKHGALAELGGSVEVRWHIAGTGGGQELCCEWRERNGPLVRQPTHEGFGSRLLKRALSAQIKAAIELDYAPAGLRAAITVVLPPPA